MKKRLFTLLTAIVLIFAIAFAVVCDFLYKESSLTQFSMGTAVSYTLYGGSKDAIFDASSLLDDIENASSLTIDNSAANKLNQEKHTDNAFLLEQAQVCLDVFAASNGAFDFSIYPVCSLWAIGTDKARVPLDNELSEALLLVDSGKISCSGGTLTLGEGQKVDFGAVGKGYACDKLVQLLSYRSRGGIVSVGGSIGVWGRASLFKSTYKIALRDPFSSGYAGYIKLSSGFVSTSGAYERYFELDGVFYHHVIDPKTAYPAKSELASATVIASSGALSDALSTACFVLGAEKGAALLKHYGAAGIFITDTQEIILVGDVDFSANDGFEVIK